MERRYLLIRVSIVSTLVCGMALLYFFIDARFSGLFPKCPFFVLTGLYCPGCGSQRATSALLHGDIIKAFRYNFLFVTSLPFVLYSAFGSLLNVFGPNSFTQRIFYSPLFAKMVFVLIVLFGILRNIPVYPFIMLAPQSELG